MPAPRVARARDLVDELEAGLHALPEFAQVVVTLDERKIASGHRHGAVLVAPPDLDFTTFEHVDASYELHVIAGPAGDMLRAWERIDSIIDALQGLDVNLRRARPATFTRPDGAPLPAYTLTLHPLDD